MGGKLRTRCSFVIAVALTAACLSAGPARAQLSGYSIERLAFEGDADPVAGTLTQIIGDPDLDESGRVTFVSYVDDGVDAFTRIFRFESGALGIEVSSGDPVPGASGLSFSDLGRPRIAAPGVLAYVGLYDDAVGDVQWGGFLRQGGADSAIAVPGMAAPGGGTIDQVLYVHAAISAPAAAIGAMVDTGGASPLAVHLVHENGQLREIYREGQPAPAAVGGTFTGVQVWWIPALIPDGTAIFYADVAGGSVASGLFESSPQGVVTPVLLAGDPVTTPGGGTFESFFRLVGANGDGDLVIAPFVQRAPLLFGQQALFVLEGASQREIVFRGDPIPGTNPPRFYAQLAGSGAPALNRSGTVAFVGILTDALQNLSERALLIDAGGGLRVLLKEGDAVPGVAGATFTDFLQVRMSDDGAIVFYGLTTAGTGIFRATPPAKVPAVPAFGLALLAFGLLAGSAWAR
jgi:hypothetical protein